MRPMIRIMLIVIAFGGSLLESRLANLAFAEPGEQITQFLNTCNPPSSGQLGLLGIRLPVTLYHTQPLRASATPPRPEELADDPIRQVELRSDVGFDVVRKKLTSALVAVPGCEGLPEHFHPDFCIFHRFAENDDENHITVMKNKILWIDSNPASLQMELWVTGRPVPSDRVCIHAPGMGVQLSFALRTLIAAAEIDRFLNLAKCYQLPVEFFRVNPGTVASAAAPALADQTNERNWPSRLTNDPCSKHARDLLAKALTAAPLPTPYAQPFQPDCCLVFRSGIETSALWIDSAPSQLQMQLWRNGKDGPVGISGISAPPGGVAVQQALEDFWKSAETVFDTWYRVVPPVTAEKGPNLDLMSIDPKQADDVLDQKHWTAPGTISAKFGDPNWIAISQAVGIALDPQAGPANTAKVFRPRLAVAVTASEGRYLLLMSFESRLAKLYLRGKGPSDSQPKCLGCYGVNNLPGGDQILNNILVAAGKSLKPKGAPSGN